MAIEVAEGISGSLQEMTLTDLLRILAWNGRSGALLLWDGPRQVGLFFEQGRITRALMSEPLAAPIEAALLLAGRVNPRRLEAARAAFAQPAWSIGRLLRLLAAEDDLSDAGLGLAQVAAIRETMQRALLWTRGDMQFKPNVPPLLARGLADLNVEELLIDGLRELDEHNAQVTPQTVVRWAPAPPHGLTATMIGPARWQTLGACNGRRSVAEVAESLGRDLAVVIEHVQWMLDRGAVLLTPPPPTPLAMPAPVGLPMEDRIVLLLSRFETSWPTGRLTAGKAAGALAKMVNIVGHAYLEHWTEQVRPEARERVWRSLVLPELRALVADDPQTADLGLTADREALRDGQLVAPRALAGLPAAADRAPAAVLPALNRLLERALLRAVGEIERPVALVDSFESVNVFSTELSHRLAALTQAGG